jgi:hypothetical protein
LDHLPFSLPLLISFSLCLSSPSDRSYRKPTVARGEASLAASAVAPVVVEPVGCNRIPHQVQVLREAFSLSEAAVDPAAPVGLAAVLGRCGSLEASRGSTSEPQAGQWNTPSGRRRISG